MRFTLAFHARRGCILSYSLDVSVLYHYVRGQEVIKLYMAASVLECFDKLCCSFNGNVLDALTTRWIKLSTPRSTSFREEGTFRLRFTTICGRDLVDVCHGIAYVCVIAPRGNFIDNEFTHQRDVVGFNF